KDRRVVTGVRPEIGDPFGAETTRSGVEMIQRRIVGAVAGTAVAVLALAGCAGSEPEGPGTDDQGATTGTNAELVTLTMWTRSVTAAQSEALVAAFNEEHEGEIEIELTVVPHTEYLQKV